MRISLPPVEVGEEEGFTKSKDIFGLKYLGDGMTNLIANVDDPLVIAFDGQWGAGKTTFLKMWAGELRKQGYPTIYFDAFENDYVEDAFAALVREVTALIESKAETGAAIAKTLKERAIGLGKLIGLAGAKIGVKVAVRAATAGLASDKDVASAVEEVTDASGDIAEKYMEEMLSEPTKQKQTVQSFRDALSRLPALLSPPAEGEKQKPLVFIIDELDRCKPVFALQMLERIKHFLTVPNMHFVLGVHLAQLRHSVKVAYGADVDAVTYLQKFINLTITYSDPSDRPHDRRTKRYLRHLLNNLDLGVKDQGFAKRLYDFLSQVVEHNDMGLRTIERIVTNAVVSMAFWGNRTLPNTPIFAGLCVLKSTRPDLFLKAKRGLLRYDDIEGLFGFEFTVDQLNKDNSDSPSWEQCWWLLCTLNNIPQHVQDKITKRFNGRMVQPEYSLQTIANEVVDRISVN